MFNNALINIIIYNKIHMNTKIDTLENLEKITFKVAILNITLTCLNYVYFLIEVISNKV